MPFDASGRSCCVLDVAFEPGGLVYHSRTISGRGAGTDIVTRLDPVGPHETRIAVAFLVPDVAAKQVERLGAAYVRLYTRLWDEDQAMMRRRQDVLDGRLAVAARVVPVEGRRIRHVTTCPIWAGRSPRRRSSTAASRARGTATVSICARDALCRRPGFAS